MRKRGGGLALPMLVSEMLLSDAELKAVGCLAVEASHFESAVEGLISVLTTRVVSQLLLPDSKMLKAKVDTLQAVMNGRLRKKAQREECKLMFDAIASDISKRNTVIHGVWESTGGGYTLSEVLSGTLTRTTPAIAKKAKGKHVVKASEVMELAEAFSQHGLNLYAFYLNHLTPRPPRRKLQRQAQ